MNDPHFSLVFDGDPLGLLFRADPLPAILQGITGRMGQRHAALMQAYGTLLVGGVSTHRKGIRDKVNGIPVFCSCSEAVAETSAIASIIMVPPFDVRAAIKEAVDAGIRLIVSVTEGVPVHDAVYALQLVKEAGVRWIGASTPGVAVPGKLKLGFLPDASLSPGKVGVMAKSGTLSYEVNHRLVKAGLGQSVWVGVGGDSVKGTRFRDVLPHFVNDPNTEQILVVGEIGGAEEEELAEALVVSPTAKPVHALIAGRGVREGQVMGHAGAVVYGRTGSYAAKQHMLSRAGVNVWRSLDQIVREVVRSQQKTN